MLHVNIKTLVRLRALVSTCTVVSELSNREEGEEGSPNRVG